MSKTSAIREPVSQVLLWLDGENAAPTDITDLAADWSVNRTPEDSAEQASLFSGTISAQATVVLDKQSTTVPDAEQLLSREFSPYVDGTLGQLRIHSYGLRMKVQVLYGFDALTPVFTGRVSSVDVSDGGVVTLTCSDFARDLLGQTTLPTAVVADPKLDPYTLAEFLLRSGGFYLTPPTVENGCLLSVPNLLPEVGHLADTSQGYPIKPNSYDAPASVHNMHAYLWGSSSRHHLRYEMDSPITQEPGTTLIVEGWFEFHSSDEDRPWDLIAFCDRAESNISYYDHGVLLGTTSSKRLCLVVPDGSEGHRVITLGTFPTAFDDPLFGSVFPYLLVEITFGQSGDISWWAQAGDDPPATGSATGVSFYNTEHNSAWFGTRFQGASVRQLPTAQYIRQSNKDWQPNFDVDLHYSLSTTRVPINGISEKPSIHCVPAVTGSAWSIIQDISSSIGGWCGWSPSGEFEWWGRDERDAVRFGSGGPIQDHTRELIHSGYSFDDSSLRSAVTIDYTDYVTSESTESNPLWSATETLTVPANTTKTFDIDTPGRLPTKFQPFAYPNFVVWNLWSEMTAVYAYQVGDPAAAEVAGYRMAVTARGEGFTLTITNGGPQEIAFWNPSTGQPHLVIHGSYVTAIKSTHTARASLKSREVLPLPASPWRQTPNIAKRICEAVAAEVAQPAMVFGEQRIVSDPDLIIGQNVRIQAPDVMDEQVSAQVVGINYGRDEYSLTVRACYPPTGWVLGIYGRSEIGSTAILIA